VNKILSALLALVAVFLAYSFATVSVPAASEAQPSFGEKLAVPFNNIQGGGVILLILGGIAILGALFFLFSKSRSEKAKGMSSTQLAARFSALGKKTKGLEVGFLLNGLLAFGIIVLVVFGAIKAWFDEAALGALGAVYILQVLMGILFLILFFGKKDKSVLPFIPAIALFLFQVAAGVFGLLMAGPK